MPLPLSLVDTKEGLTDGYLPCVYRNSDAFDTSRDSYGRLVAVAISKKKAVD